ncbi:MAG: hypothetical protein GXZ11_04185 [Tissierellia bacterium]|nr:hypothetical protein [Tissierellia bacterium]
MKKALIVLIVAFMLLFTACGGGGGSEPTGGGPEVAMANLPEGAEVIEGGKYEGITITNKYEGGFGEKVRYVLTLKNNSEEDTYKGEVYAVFFDADGNVIGQEKSNLSGLKPNGQLDLIFWSTTEAVEGAEKIYFLKAE